VLAWLETESALICAEQVVEGRGHLAGVARHGIAHHVVAAGCATEIRIDRACLMSSANLGIVCHVHSCGLSANVQRDVSSSFGCIQLHTNGVCMSQSNGSMSWRFGDLQLVILQKITLGLKV